MFKSLAFDDKKAQSLVTWAIKRPRVPRSVVIPLTYRHEPPSEIEAEERQQVHAGQKIAAATAADAITRHAPISGTVFRIGNYPHPWHGETLGIEIQSNGTDETAAHFPQLQGFKQDPFSFFQQMGIVDLNPEMEPLHVKMAAACKAGVETLIINGCDPEPYITSNYSLAMSHALEVLKGAEILRRVSGARRLLLAFQKNQMNVVELIRSKIYFLHWDHAEVVVHPSQYPNGLDALVLWDALKTDAREIEEVQDRALLLNLATAFAVYEAVECGKPLLERVVTVGGECVVEAKNVWVPLGTSLEETFRFCGGLLRDPGRVLVNGPMTGEAQSTLAVPVLAGTAAVLALSKEVVGSGETLACDRCARCIDVCPSKISPVEIVLAAERQQWDIARNAGVGLCIECAACAAICPSRIPMTSLIRSAKYAHHRSRFSRTPSPLHSEAFSI